MVEYLIRTHYDTCSRPLRRCQARDLIEQVRYYCDYNELPLELTEEYLDQAVRTYFTVAQGRLKQYDREPPRTPRSPRTAR